MEPTGFPPTGTEPNMTVTIDNTIDPNGITAPEPSGSPLDAEPPTVARVEDGSRIYGSGGTEVVALDHVDVEFASGEFVAIMGPSGAGKSTLLHCLAGLDRLSSGRVFIGDRDITAAGEKELTLLRRDHLGFVFQSYNLVPTLTAAENITLPLDLAGRKPDREWLDEVIGIVGLGDRLTHRPDELSGGQQQRVAVARAMVGRPALILADEPTGNLDSRSGGEILRFLRLGVGDLGLTVVMVTHDPVAAACSDRVVFVTDGRITDELAEPDVDGVIDHMRLLGR